LLSFFLPNFSSTIDYRFYLSLLPEKLLIICICLAILNAFSAKAEVKAGILLNNYLNYFSTFFFGAALYWICYLYGFSLNNIIFSYNELNLSNATFFVFYDTLKFNKLIIQIKIVIALLVGAALLTAKRHLLLNNLINYEYPIVISLATLGMFASIMANNWIILFLSLELQALCFLLLFAWNRRNLKAVTAALKFSVVNFIASLFILLAIVEIILYTGSFNMLMANPIYNLSMILEISEKSNGMHLFMDTNVVNTLRKLFSGDTISNMLFFILNNMSHNYQEVTWNVGTSLLVKNSDLMFWDLVSFLLIMGFVIKLGLAPFGLWLQDLYTSVSLPVLTFFSTAPKITYITILVSLYMNLFIVVNPDNFLNIIYILSIISIVIANLSMFSIRDNLLKLLAWSSIANMGLLLFLFSFNPLKSYVFIYIIYYTFGTLLLFLALQYIVINDHMNKKRNILYFSDLTVLRNHVEYRPLCLVIVFSLLSSFGIPPLMGFWVKFAAIQGIVSNSAFMSFTNWVMVIFILLVTLIGGYNYLRMIYTILSETTNSYLNIAYLAISKEDALVCVLSFILFQVLFLVGYDLNTELFDLTTNWKYGLYVYVN